jgi:hypothetical protein
VRVGGVGLAALSGGENPCPRGQLGWHIDDVLANGHKPVRGVPTDALASLDRPHPVRPLLGVSGHCREAIAVLTRAAWRRAEESLRPCHRCNEIIATRLVAALQDDTLHERFAELRAKADSQPRTDAWAVPDDDFAGLRPSPDLGTP